ncbi:MAG TPA: 2Fe-2S iron-sulfur cluster-binding protein, partial [Dermatophilaceae bacterium]|nr:2Fe-2S iron-sulfur cluster-binding protein [Dermatophilaceae bacterium]
MTQEWTVTIEPIGREVLCREDQSILDACLRAGVWLPHSCTHGTCATCKCEVVDGDVDHGEASSF